MVTAGWSGVREEMAVMKYKLVAKSLAPNMTDIIMVTAAGEFRTIARVEFPNDNQMMDNNTCTEEIIKALYKRLRKSI